MFNDATEIIVISPGGTEELAIPEPMPSNGVTLGTNNITIVTAGDYLVEFMVLLQSTTGSFDLTLGVQIDGVFTNPSLFTSTIITADFEIITISSIATLAASSVLTLAVSSVAGGTLLFGPALNTSLYVVRLGD